MKSCDAKGCWKAPGVWIPKRSLSPGQREEINRVYDAYPHLNDDDFVLKDATSGFGHDATKSLIRTSLFCPIVIERHAVTCV